MGLPKKGLRKIEHKGNKYGWLIRRNPTYNQALSSPMTLAIQELGCETPKVLYVTLNIDRPDSWLGEHQTQIRPKHIVEIIEEAQKHGWEYDAGGAVFEFHFDKIIKHT